MSATKAYKNMSTAELEALYTQLQEEFSTFKSKNLHLDMSRGKPEKGQLRLSADMLTCVTDAMLDSAEPDVRNYGLPNGIPEMRQLFADMLHVPVEEVLAGGNSSLNMMYDTIARAMQFGVLGSKTPWSKLDKVKFLCPAPGYDRHFAICELFGIEMIPVPMTAEGPEMDLVETLVSTDAAIKGIWCVPKYSNPTGITYSDAVVRRLANLKPAATDFRIFWDNAYCVHHLYGEYQPDTLLNIMDESKKAGNPDMVFMFASTSKITYPGAGVAAMVASIDNLKFIQKQLTIQTIGPDKINQFRHVAFLKDMDGVTRLMQQHADIIRPKFAVVLEKLEAILGNCEIASWTKPNGGYFISVDVMEGCAKRVGALCKEAGVVLTPPGVTFPYGKDPKDENIRIAPTYPPMEELIVAMDLFCLCVRLAAIEKLLNK
ncbi:MAG TPA: aminotransferase class I/II-fold pyridoxal phosphate-dependent enzyme [Firmicutes bacterium]|nr:aminotransferase class I/II-fold pyridoxal phosphate-dependent enzyme [Bacillota bacterium]